MPTYRLLHGSMYRWVNGVRTVQHPGDLIADFTAEEIKTHSARLEFVSPEPAAPRATAVASDAVVAPPSDSPASEPDAALAPEEEEDYDWTEVLAGNVASIKEYVAGLDEVDILKSLLRAEREGVGRKGVLVAAVDRIKALGGTIEEE